MSAAINGAAYPASHIKRRRATKAEVEARRSTLLEVTLMEMAPDAEIYFERRAVTPEQIDAWDLPSRPTKTTDSRSKNFGDISVELDAIEPNMLRDLVEQAIQQHLPSDRFAILKAAEDSERELIAGLVGMIKGAAP